MLHIFVFFIDSGANGDTIRQSMGFLRAPTRSLSDPLTEVTRLTRPEYTKHYLYHPRFLCLLYANCPSTRVVGYRQRTQKLGMVKIMFCLCGRVRGWPPEEGLKERGGDPRTAGWAPVRSPYFGEFLSPLCAALSLKITIKMGNTLLDAFVRLTGCLHRGVVGEGDFIHCLYGGV